MCVLFYATAWPELWLHLFLQRLRFLNCVLYVVPLRSKRKKKKKPQTSGFISVLMIVLLHFMPADTLWHLFAQLQLMQIVSLLSSLVSQTLMKILRGALAFKFLPLWYNCVIWRTWN